MRSDRDAITRYVILFQARSGSTYLTEVLDSHPDVYAMGEKFAERKKKGPARQLGAMRRFFERVPDGDFAAIGFKTVYKLQTSQAVIVAVFVPLFVGMMAGAFLWILA